MILRPLYSNLSKQAIVAHILAQFVVKPAKAYFLATLQITVLNDWIFHSGIMAELFII